MTAIANPTIFPSLNDISVVEFEGDTGTEATLTQWINNFSHQNFVLNGFGTSAGAGLNVDVASGIAMVNGFRVSVPAATTVVMADDTTNYIFLQLSFDGSSHVDGVDFTTNTTGVAPSDSVLICTVLTAASAIVTITDKMQRSAIYVDTVASASNRGINDGVYEAIPGTAIVIPATVLAHPRLCIAFFSSTWYASDVTFDLKLDLDGTYRGELINIQIPLSFSTNLRLAVSTVGMGLIAAGSDATIQAMANSSGVACKDSNMVIALL